MSSGNQSTELSSPAKRQKLAPNEILEGSRAYKSSIAFVLGAAVDRCKLGRLRIEETVGASFVFGVSNSHSDEPNNATCKLLADAMHDIISENRPISRVSMLRSEAMSYFKKCGAERTVQLVTSCSEPEVLCHVMDGNPNGKYCAVAYGEVVASTAKINENSFSVEVCLKPSSHYRLYYTQRHPVSGELNFSRAEEPKLLSAYILQKRWLLHQRLQTVSEINTEIVESRGNSVVQISEAMHDHQIVNIAACIGGNLGEDITTNATALRPRLILIAGPSSSGKTTFAKRLSVSLETLGLKPIVLSVDSYYKGWQSIDERGPQFVDWESLHSLNLEMLNEHLIELLAGKEVLVPEYDMKTSMPTEQAQWTKTTLPAGGLIIMEGIHCLNPTLTNKIPKQDKFQIMISPLSAVAIDDTCLVSSTQVRMMRRMVRDFLFRGRSASSTLKQWPAVLRGERLNIFPNQNNADIVMNSALVYEPNVLKVFAEPLLRTITPDRDEYCEAQRLLDLLSRVVTMPATVVPPQSLLREFVGGSWFYDYAGWYKSA